MQVIAEWRVPDPNGKRDLSGMHIFKCKSFQDASRCAEWFLDFASGQKESWASPWSNVRVTIQEGEV